MEHSLLSLNSENCARPVRRRDVFHGPSEAEISSGMTLVKKMLASSRRDSSLPLTIVRMRATRAGWSVLYREGAGPQQAIEVDMRGNEFIAEDFASVLQSG